MSKNKPRYNEIIFSEVEINKIINMYKSNISIVTIGKEFNVSHKTIAKVLDKQGIPRTGISRRKYQIDENILIKLIIQIKLIYSDFCMQMDIIH